MPPKGIKITTTEIKPVEQELSTITEPAFQADCKDWDGQTIRVLILRTEHPEYAVMFHPNYCQPQYIRKSAKFTNVTPVRINEVIVTPK